MKIFKAFAAILLLATSLFALSKEQIKPEIEAKTTKGDFTLEEELEKFTENNIISYRGKARLEEAKNYIRNITIRQILQNGQNLLVTLCTLIVEKII